MEKRNNLLEKLETILNKSKAEKRSLTGAEQTEFNKATNEIKNIDRQLQITDLESQKALLETREIKGETAEKRAQLEAETRALMDYIVKADMRALSASGSGGAVVPTEISKMIVDKVVNQSLLLKNSTIFNTNADLTIPVTDFTQITTAYLTEGTTITDTGTDFSSVKLTNKIIGALIKLGRSLVNRSDIEILPYLVNQMAKNLGWFIEKELVTGTGTARLSGLVTLPAGQQFTGATTGVIASDELIDLQLKLPQSYQDNAIWVMNPTTLASIYKLKDSAGNFLFNRGDMGANLGLTLLGKPVMLSDSMPTNGVGALPIYYLNPACMYVKMTQDVQVLTLDQTFAQTYQYGILGAVEMDSAIAETQGIVAYKGK